GEFPAARSRRSVHASRCRVAAVRRRELRPRLFERRPAPHAEHQTCGCGDSPRAQARRTGHRDGLRRELAAILAEPRLAPGSEGWRPREPFDGRHHVAYGRAIGKRRAAAGKGLHQGATSLAVQRLPRHPDRSPSALAGARAATLVDPPAGHRARRRLESDPQGLQAVILNRASQLLSRLRRRLEVSSPTPAAQAIAPPPPPTWHDDLAAAGLGADQWVAKRLASDSLYVNIGRAQLERLRAEHPQLVDSTIRAAERVLQHEFCLLGSGPY